MPLKGSISNMIATLHRENKGKAKPRSNAQIAAIAYAVKKRNKK